MSGWSSIYTNVRSMLQVQGEQLARLQEMAATGLRIVRPSDSPTDAFKVLGYRDEVRSLDTYIQNLDSVVDSISMSSTILQQISTCLARARTLAAQAATGTYSESQRLPNAMEIDAILEQILSLANTTHRGRYIFGGGAAEKPYVETREGSTIVRVSYRGGQDTLPVPVSGDIEYGSVLAGNEVFGSNRRQEAVFFGQTGARPGAGTSTIRGDAWLTLTHLATTYEGASGIMPGDDSATGDTILGVHHTLTVDAVSRTLQLDDGPVVAYQGDETNLRLANAAGDIAYVNVCGVTAGFQGTVTIWADGLMSIDDGKTSAPIFFSSADAVTDSATGRVLYVDTSDVARTGLEPVRVPGTYDVFAALVSVRDAIRNSRNLGDAQRQTIMDNAMTALQEVTDRLSEAITATGAHLQALDSLKSNLQNVQEFSRQQASALSDADIVDVAMELARRQTLYQMTLTSAARLLSMSLINYL